MPIICNWCPVPHQIGVKPCLPEYDGEISHGVCPEALAKKLAAEKELATETQGAPR